MKTKISILAAAVIAVSTWTTSAMAGQVDTMTTFEADTPAVAAEVNGNFDAVKSAVDDNDSRITANEENINTNTDNITVNTDSIATNTGNITANTDSIATNQDDIAAIQSDASSLDRVFDDQIKFRLSVSDSSTDDFTNIVVYLRNTTSTDCEIYYSTSSSGWVDGANTTSSFTLTPTYTAKTLRGSSYEFLQTTRYLEKFVVDRNLSGGTQFVDVTLNRNETDASDTCDAGDVVIMNVEAIFPDGTRVFVPASEMIGH
ncbi:MAG: hypothetical protein R6X15_10210 [Pseudomonadota bacterium]